MARRPRPPQQRPSHPLKSPPTPHNRRGTPQSRRTIRCSAAPRRSPRRPAPPMPVPRTAPRPHAPCLCRRRAYRNSGPTIRLGRRLRVTNDEAPHETAGPYGAQRRHVDNLDGRRIPCQFRGLRHEPTRHAFVEDEHNRSRLPLGDRHHALPELRPLAERPRHRQPIGRHAQCMATVLPDAQRNTRWAQHDASVFRHTPVHHTIRSHGGGCDLEDGKRHARIADSLRFARLDAHV